MNESFLVALVPRTLANIKILNIFLVEVKENKTRQQEERKKQPPLWEVASNIPLTL